MADLLVSEADAIEYVGEDQIRNQARFVKMLAGLSDFIRAKIDRPIEIAEGIDTLDGNGESTLRLTRTPVTELDTVEIDGEDVTADCKVYDHGDLYYDGGVFPTGHQNVVVTYSAGFEETVPERLQLAVLLIMDQMASTDTLKQATRGEYDIIFDTDKWPKNAREIIESFCRKS